MFDLILHTPLNREAERCYVSDVIFGEFLGLSVQVVSEDRDDWCLTDIEGHSRIIMPDSFFNRANQAWLTPESMPATPLAIWRVARDLPEATLVKPEVPVIAGESDQEGAWYAQIDDQTARLGLDVLGSAFFMLTRYEEIVIPERDKHDRFPATASLAYKEGFLERPIVNEYLEVLWAVMKRLWPGLKRKERMHRIYLSHDVDRPLSTISIYPIQLLKNVINITLRLDLLVAKKLLVSFYEIRKDIYENDPYNSFDFIINMSERYGYRSSFYFFSNSPQPIDGNYSIDDKCIMSLIKKIHERGHELGLHTTYNSYLDPNATKGEFESLLTVMETLKISQSYWGGRQHYLRWENPTTWENLEIAGLDYDSTVGYADRVGFRCGCCYEYPVFNLRKRAMSNLKERPLVVMEGTLFGYMCLNFEESLSKILDLKNKCQAFYGDFTLLWHNSSLVTNDERYWYTTMLEEISK